MTDTPMSISRNVEAAVLALNNAHAVDLSWLEGEQLTALLSQAFYARRIGSLDAFLIALDERRNLRQSKLSVVSSALCTVRVC